MDLWWDNFDNAMSGTNDDSDPFIIGLLNRNTTYDGKISAFYGYYDSTLDSDYEAARENVYGWPPSAQRLPYKTNTTLAIGVIMANGLEDVSGKNLYPRTDGFVPDSSAFFSGHSIAERVECPGYNHAELHDGRGDYLPCNSSGTFKSKNVLDAIHDRLTAIRPFAEDTPASMVSPANGTILSGSSVTFQWNLGSGVAEVQLFVGTSQGQSDIYTAWEGIHTSDTVSGLPTNGQPVYVTLQSTIQGKPQTKFYTYTASGATGVYALTVSTTGSGTVTSSDGYVNCGSSCAHVYSSGTSVSLNAAPASGWIFSGWGGACNGTDSCNVTMAATTAVTANFTTSGTTAYTLTVNSSNPSSGVGITVSPTDINGYGDGPTSFTRTYNQNAQVTLTAQSTAGGNNFSSWTGCDPGSGTSSTCTVTMTASRAVTANYTTPSTPSAYNYSVLYRFGFDQNEAKYVEDGSNPRASLVQDAAGNLYGTTGGGGTSKLGTVFKLDTAGRETVLHNFSGTDGENPFSGVIQDATGNLYGTMRDAIPNGSVGLLYKLDTSGHETVLYNFCSATNCTDGSTPYAALIRDAAGNLYGTTASGGDNGEGTVFKLDIAGQETVLHSFFWSASSTDGTGPMAGLIQDGAGNLYGTTAYGGANSSTGGTIFKLDTAGQETLLYSFCSVLSNPNPGDTVVQVPTCADGKYPLGLIQDAAGNLYGITEFGGANGSGNGGSGTIFTLDASGHYSVLYNFCSAANCADGQYPLGLIRDTAGNLYGTTESGGANGAGTVFKLDTTGHETVLYNFCSGPVCLDGTGPMAGVIQDAAGNLYGTTESGGTPYNWGTVFKLSPASANSGAATHTLTVNSANPSSGVEIAASPADNNGAANGTTSFALTYSQNTQVTLTAPSSAGGNSFSSWTGCDPGSGTTTTCTVTMAAAKTVTASYGSSVLTAATPIFSPAAGTYSTTQTVSISDSTAGAIVYYTTDGTTPTAGSSVYSGPIIVSSTELIKAIAIASGYFNSAEASSTYTVTTSIVPGEWTWMGGSAAISQAGVYGTQGVADVANIPPSRNLASSWSDGNGNLWLFGGYQGVSGGSSNYLNDLWRFNLGTNEWTWVNGGNTANQPGVYGTQGVPNAANVPSARAQSANWTDRDGNLWLFGGGFNYVGNGSILYGVSDELWELNPATGVWTWVGGGDGEYCCGSPVYGTKGVPSTANTPGGKEGAITWTDGDGNLWLFGGFGWNNDTFNDLWKFNPTDKTWTWVSGANSANQPGIYGTKGVPSDANVPGARGGSVSWTDSNGNFWLFGGRTIDSSKSRWGYLNDLWEFSPTNKTWTWMSGANSADQLGVYGTQGVPDTANTPGARDSAVSWVDSSKKFWLFGGDVEIGSTGTYYPQNDLWKFDPTNNVWTWVSGGNVGNTPGVWGSHSLASTSNVPSARGGAANCVDGSGNLWLFGGYGSDSSGSGGPLNDLWVYDPSSAILPAAATPTFSVAAGNYATAQTISISDVTPGATIYYTIDGTTPTAGSPLYGAPITISLTKTIKAIAVASGYSVSAVATATYTISTSKTTPTVMVSPNPTSITTAQALTVTVAISVGSGNPTATGSVTLSGGGYTSAATALSSGSATINIPAGSLATGSDTLTVTYTPDSNSSSTYYSTTGSNSVTVTAPAKTTPTVTVTPSALSITTAQALTVTVAVSGGSGNPTPTGSVTLTGGGYTSAASTLSSGGATINIPAGSLATGNDTLTVSYTPDSNSSSTYNSATGSNSVTVTIPAKTTPTVTVTPSASSISTAQALTVTVVVSGGTGNPTPSGTVTLSSGSYSTQQTLASGAASFTIAAGTLGNGANTLTASYSGDATYAVASSTTTVTVEPVSISTTVPSPASPGSSTTSSVTLTGSTGYSGMMNLSCSLTSSPTGAVSLPTCVLNPASVALASCGVGTSTLTVKTTAASSTALARPTDQHLLKLGGGAVLAALLLFGIPFRRRRWISMLVLLLLVAAAGVIGCGGGTSGGGGGPSTPVTTAGNYTFTVAATDSANAKITASTTVSVIVQ
jgi:uncharacterized repeat protein (TIGR03803 family)